MPTAPILELHDLGYRYGRRTALEAVHLELGPAVVLVLLGLNGAGKSTLLRLVAGDLRPSFGAVRVLGRDPRKSVRARRELLHLHEVAEPAPWLTAGEVIELQLALFERRLGRAARMAILESFGLGAVAKQRVQTFSKGMRRRLELAALTAVDPPLWLLDEPQSGLDPDGIVLLRDAVRAARERGRAVVVATHALSDVQAIADRVLLLEKGRTRFAGTTIELVHALQAQGYAFAGGTEGLDARLRALAQETGATLEGPFVPLGALEEWLCAKAKADAEPRS